MKEKEINYKLLIKQLEELSKLIVICKKYSLLHLKDELSIVLSVAISYSAMIEDTHSTLLKGGSDV